MPDNAFKIVIRSPLGSKPIRQHYFEKPKDDPMLGMEPVDKIWSPGEHETKSTPILERVGQWLKREDTQTPVTTSEPKQEQEKTPTPSVADFGSDKTGANYIVDSAGRIVLLDPVDFKGYKSTGYDRGHYDDHLSYGNISGMSGTTSSLPQSEIDAILESVKTPREELAKKLDDSMMKMILADG